MKQRYPGLRSIFTAAMLVIVTVAVGVSIALVVVTARLHSASQVLADAVESVNLANEAETGLLLHGRTGDAIARRGLEGDLKGTIVALRAFVTSPAEAWALDDVSHRIDRYFGSARADGEHSALSEKSLDAAYEALDALVAVNLEHARAARAHVARWDSVARGVGLSTALSLLFVAAWFGWWLRARAFRPVVSLLQSMERFGRGDRDVRASEVGPSELHDLAKRFNEMAAALAAQRELQMSFLGGVVHDLRSPLAALKLTTGSARRTDKLSPEERLDRLCVQTERQIIRMERMLGDLLDTARIEAGKLELRFDRRDLRDLVREVASLLEPTSSRHQLIVDVPDDEVPIRCDPLRIEQVLTNLIGNGIKFSPNGGRITVTLKRDGADAVVTVGDSGIGISKEDQCQLFEPFRRVGPTKNVIPGVGLGLFVVREIVRAHGGRIEVASAPAQGTEFRVSLPANMSPEARFAAATGPADDRALLPH